MITYTILAEERERERERENIKFANTNKVPAYIQSTECLYIIIKKSLWLF